MEFSFIFDVIYEFHVSSFPANDMALIIWRKSKRNKRGETKAVFIKLQLEGCVNIDDKI